MLQAPSHPQTIGNAQSTYRTRSYQNSTTYGCHEAASSLHPFSPFLRRPFSSTIHAARNPLMRIHDFFCVVSRSYMDLEINIQADDPIKGFLPMATFGCTKPWYLVHLRLPQSATNPMLSYKCPSFCATYAHIHSHGSWVSWRKDLHTSLHDTAHSHHALLQYGLARQLHLTKMTQFPLQPPAPSICKV